ncbi:MAG: nuclear transport factor 2 family protein [Pseudomonadales bacterium]
MQTAHVTQSAGDSDFAQVNAIVHAYCDGLYTGDVAKLRAIFHPDAYLKAPGSRRSVEQWLADVGTRATPLELGDSYRFELMAIEVIQQQAMVKLACPLFAHDYLDFLGLLKEDGRWLIVNKMYCDLALAQP